MSPLSSLSVATYTPRAPYAVGPKEPLGNARRLMEKYALRDLPVRAEGKLVGMLSERDIRLFWSRAAPLFETLAVEQAMSAEPYAVSSITPLGVVVRTMLDKDLDAVIVSDEGRIVGVFTSKNAMEALVDLLEPKRTRADERPRSSQIRRAGRRRDSR